MNADGSMNDLAGADLRGLDRFKARKVAEEKLSELGAFGGSQAVREQRGLQPARGCADRAAAERAMVLEVSRRARIQGLRGGRADEVSSRPLGKGFIT
jgi:hypothetical protein